MADEQFHFAVNKWDITKIATIKTNKNKRKRKKKQTNNNYKTQKYEFTRKQSSSWSVVGLCSGQTAEGVSGGLAKDESGLSNQAGSGIHTVLLGSLIPSSLLCCVSSLVCSQIVRPWFSTVPCHFISSSGLARFVLGSNILFFVERRETLTTCPLQLDFIVDRLCSKC